MNKPILPFCEDEIVSVEDGKAIRRTFYRLVNAREAPGMMPASLDWVRGRLAALSPEAGPESPQRLPAPPNFVATPELRLGDPALLAFHAPLALLEGAWLQSVAQAADGHLHAVAHLFAGYLGLLGRTEAESPAAAYRGALALAKISLPQVTAWRFAQDERVGEPALAFASLQLALGLHSRALFPELIGFTLGYAQSASPLRLVALSAEYRRAILERLGECAGQALRAHLDACKGDEARQWARVRRGYALYQQTEAEYLVRVAAISGEEPSLADRVAEIFRRKAGIARGFHHNAVLEGRFLNDWFAEEPFDAAGFLRAFSASPYGKGSAGARPFDRLTGFGGPMFGVFDEQELGVIAAWLDNARDVGTTNVPNAATAMTVESIATMPKVRSTVSTSSHLNIRELFYHLINADLFPQVADLARRQVEVELARAARALRSSGPLRARFFAYTPEVFAERIRRIHDEEVARYRPFRPPPKLNYEEYVWGIRQFAPAILVDGCWLQHMGEAADQDDRVRRLLFRIYADELGCGEVRRNHPNVYRDLLGSLAIDLPPVDSEAFARHPGFLDAAFDLPVYLLGISLFPRSFKPEILGLNLAIELSGLGAGYMRLIDELRYWGIDPLIVSLHLSIDNLASGHAALAVEAVQLFLDEILANGGEGAVDASWRRIWRGYLSLGTATHRFKWALGLDFCRRFVPARIRRKVGVSLFRGGAGQSV